MVEKSDDRGPRLKIKRAHLPDLSRSPVPSMPTEPNLLELSVVGPFRMIAARERLDVTRCRMRARDGYSVQRGSASRADRRSWYMATRMVSPG